MKRIQESLLRQDIQDKIYIGEVAEKFYNSQAGDLLRAFVNGMQSTEIKRYEYDQNTNSDLKMGRIEGMQMVIEAFERAIEEGNDFKKPIKTEEENVLDGPTEGI